MYSRFLISALFAGAAAGLIAGLLILYFVQPVLLHAELYEGGELLHFGADKAATAHPALPGIDPVRDGLSLIFSMLTYSGYALIMIAAMGLAEDRGARIDGRTGLIWGLAGFVVFQFAPAFSLPPEVPGVAAADVAARQVWWFATAITAAIALWLIAFGAGWMHWGLAMILLVAPHLVGAPEPEVFTGPVPPELAAHYASRALGVGMASWVLLGSFAGFFWQREGAHADAAASA